MVFLLVLLVLVVLELVVLIPFVTCTLSVMVLACRTSGNWSEMFVSSLSLILACEGSFLERMVSLGLLVQDQISVITRVVFMALVLFLPSYLLALH